MMNLIYRGIPYQRQFSAHNHQLSNKMAKYRGCTYDLPTPEAIEPTSKPKLTYRGCRI